MIFGLSADGHLFFAGRYPKNHVVIHRVGIPMFMPNPAKFIEPLGSNEAVNFSVCCRNDDDPASRPAGEFGASSAPIHPIKPRIFVGAVAIGLGRRLNAEHATAML